MTPRLAVVACGSPYDPCCWSGTPYHLFRELRRRFPDTHVIDTPRLDALVARGSRLAQFGILPAREPVVGAYYNSRLRRSLAELRPDVVVVVAAEWKIAPLADQWPMVVVSDSFFGNMVDYYDKYRRLSRRTRRVGDQQQRRILDAGATVVVSSEWAARTAADYYGCPRSRFHVAPFGANFEVDPPVSPLRPARGPLKLLFVGYDWIRKGGATVIDVLQRLRHRFGDVELDIVGCNPPQAVGMTGVRCHGLLRKDRAQDISRLAQLFRDASFLFVPSRQEAYGLVYAEACAFGLPSVARDIGGVGAIVHDRRSGLLLPAEASADLYAEAVAGVWSDETAYRTMRADARAAFESRLSWRAWGDATEALITDAAARGVRPSRRQR